MALQYSDLPIRDDPSRRFVPWIIAFMVYLATIALVAAILLNSLLNRMDNGFGDHLTVELSVPANVSAGEQEAAVQAIYHALSSSEAVDEVHLVEPGEITALLEPWLGGDVGARLSRHDLVLPKLFDISVKPGYTISASDLEYKLQRFVAGVHVEDHKKWHVGIAHLARSFEIIGFFIVGLVIFAAISTIAFTTQAGMIIHRDVIQVLHLVGARDRYIALQFQNYAASLGIRGSLLSLGASLATFGLFSWVAHEVDLAVIPTLLAQPWVWAVMVLVPLMVTAFMMVAARLTVILMLNRRVPE